MPSLDRTLSRAGFLASQTGGVSPSTRHFAPFLLAVIVVGALGCREDAESPTGPQSEPALATAHAVAALALRQVSAGAGHTCGVTMDNRAYCWGGNGYGQLGIGSTLDTSRPVAVARGLLLTQVSAGHLHTCGVTTDGAIYCWGLNDNGQLGNGSLSQRVRPVLVKGGLRFIQVDAGSFHTCAVTTENRAYCWGDNGYGAVGDGGTGADRLTPAAVAGARGFRRVSAGYNYSCGVTLADKAFCWGDNSWGQLGTGTRDPEDGGPRHSKPEAVAGGLSFRQVAAGDGVHTCGRTTDDRAYCWGFGGQGGLGDGTNTITLTPTAVAGGLSFRQVVAGFFRTCGVTTSERAYCWGENFTGAIGDGTITLRQTPVAVLGGLRFRGVSTSGGHTCGVTTDNRAYCWGSNAGGQLGVGTTTGPETCFSINFPCSTKPEAVIGPS
jgi:alpha-tubulin suppressor-like RCC1 family protein